MTDWPTNVVMRDWLTHQCLYVWLTDPPMSLCVTDWSTNVVMCDWLTHQCRYVWLIDPLMSLCVTGQTAVQFCRFREWFFVLIPVRYPVFQCRLFPSSIPSERKQDHLNLAIEAELKHQFVYSAACLPVCLSFCLSVCLPACLPACLLLSRFLYISNQYFHALLRGTSSLTKNRSRNFLCKLHCNNRTIILKVKFHYFGSKVPLFLLAALLCSAPFRGDNCPVFKSNMSWLSVALIR